MALADEHSSKKTLSIGDVIVPSVSSLPSSADIGSILYKSGVGFYGANSSGGWDNLTVSGSSVTGPGSSTGGALAVWNGSSGTVLSNSLPTVDGSGDLNLNGSGTGFNFLDIASANSASEQQVRFHGALELCDAEFCGTHGNTYYLARFDNGNNHGVTYLNYGNFVIDSNNGWMTAFNQTFFYFQTASYALKITDTYGRTYNTGIVASTSSQVPVVVQGASSQSGDLLQFQNSGASVLAKVDATGHITGASLNTTGHIGSTAGASPSATVNANAGTGATCTLTHDTDVTGTITIATGTGTSAGDQCDVTFASSYGVAPVCALTPSDSNAATAGAYVTSTTTEVTVNLAAAAAVSSTYSWNYTCIQTQ
jgi:hypothetical protein